MKAKTALVMALSAVLTVGQALVSGAPVGTDFVYQGRLTDGGSPANGEYDFQLKLYDALTGGSQVGSTVDVEDQQVVNGLFTAQLDFGAAVFSGEALWLEIGVRPGVETGAYTLLSTRQKLAATPYAIKALDVMAPLSLTGVPTFPIPAVIAGTHTGGGAGIRGIHSTSGNYGDLGSGSGGVYGYSNASSSAYGVYGYSSGTAGRGVYGRYGGTGSGHAVYGWNSVSGCTGHIGGPSYALYGWADAAAGRYAGYFDGQVRVGGNVLVEGTDSRVGIGTSSPSEKLEVSGAVKLSRIGNDPHLIIHDSNGSNDRPGIQFTNNNIHYIGGDDGSTEVFGFYSQYGSNRTYDAVVNIHGKANDSWGKNLSLSHNGTNGTISTDSGGLILSPASNVGIGGVDPTEKLEVGGNTKVNGTLTVTGNLNAPVTRKIKLTADMIGISGTLTRVGGGITFPPDYTNSAKAYLPMPEDWDGTSDFIVSIYFRPLGSPVLAGVANFFVRMYGVQAGEGIIDPGASTGPTVSIPADSWGVVFKQTITVPASRFSTGDDLMVIYSIQRGGTGETFTGDLSLIAVGITYGAKR